ncbi:MAG: hypothetical protein HZB36_05635 [Candidatus Omnitrophica bacterium]|nr:hypothetical protein [Candidatus Omnitrophota bacterium]
MIYKRNYFLITLIFLGLTALFTFPLIQGLDKYVYGPFFHTDIRGGVWHLWWGHYALRHGIDYYHCPFISAPTGVDFSQQPVSWIVEYSLAALLMIMSPVFCLNILTLLNFVLCGFFSFLLLRHLTKNIYASFFGAFIFTFSPYHLNKVMEFSFFYISSWFVLYVYSIMKIREKLDFKYVLYAAFAFTMATAFNPYYGYFAVVFTLGFLTFSLFYQWKEKIKLFTSRSGLPVLRDRMRAARRFMSALGVIFLIALLFNMTTIFKIVKNLSVENTNKTLAAATGYSRAISYLFAQSAKPLSYLLPASTHPVFGEFTRKMFGSVFYGRGAIEQTLYLGWVPLILAFYAYKQWKSRRLDPKKFPEYVSSADNYLIGLFLFLAWLFFILSMPPYVNLIFFKIYFPSYLLHKVFPMFRAYARFGMLVSLCVSILAGYGLKYLLLKIKRPSLAFLFTAGVCVITLFEFTNIPPWRVADISKTPAVYHWLASQDGDFIIAEYPMTKGIPGEAQENYDYLFYQTRHKKRMVNGAMPGTNAHLVKEKILKIEDQKTLSILKDLGVKYVILHSELYKTGEYMDAVDVVGHVPSAIKGLKLVKSFDNDLVYEVLE